MAIRIVVFDDETCIDETLAMILRQSGYKAAAFYSALSALGTDESRTPEFNPSTMYNSRLMKEEIQRAVEALVGQRFWEISRSADLACFSFGQQRTVLTLRGEAQVVGEFALRVHCAWRIAQDEKVVLGSHDIFSPPGETDAFASAFDWEERNRFDRIADSFFHLRRRPLIVQHVIAGHAGRLTVVLTEGCTIELFPCDSETGEHWRFFHPYEEDTHLVVTGNGIEQ